MIVLEKYYKTFLQVAFLFLMIIKESLYAENASSNISFGQAVQPQTVDVFAEAFYGYTSQTQDWAFTLSHNKNIVKTAYKTFIFDWAFGFRVGLGYNMKHDLWDTKASYTRFASTAKDQTQGPVTPAFLGARLSFLEPFSSGKARINLHYNMFDWDLGRVFFASKYQSFRPCIGLKGGWITQTIRSSWTTPDFLGFFLVTAQENLKQTFQCVGPKGGVTGKWYFKHTQKYAFSLIGQFEAAYLWGHWSIKDKFSSNLSSQIPVKTSPRNFGSFVLFSFIGLGWDCNFNCNCHLGLQVGYKIEDWFNQCQIFTDTSGSQNNDLILQGFNLGLGFDF